MNDFPELAEVNTKSWEYKKRYLIQCVLYPFYFFSHAPVNQWHDLFHSTHRVARDAARSTIALDNQPDIKSQRILLAKFRQFAKHAKHEPNSR